MADLGIGLPESVYTDYVDKIPFVVNGEQTCQTD